MVTDSCSTLEAIGPLEPHQIREVIISLLAPPTILVTKVFLPSHCFLPCRKEGCNRVSWWTRLYTMNQCNLFRELPPTTLAEILAPSSLMIGHKFELSVDEWKFIGHPFSVQSDTFSIAFNMVFVVQVKRRGQSSLEVR